MRDLWLVVALSLSILGALALQTLFVEPAALTGSVGGADSAVGDGSFESVSVSVSGAGELASGQSVLSAEGQNSAPVQNDESFDPATEVEYAAHPEEHFQIVEELDNFGNTITQTGETLQDDSLPAAPEPALGLQAQKLGLVQLAQAGTPTGNDYEFPDMQSDDGVGSPQRMVIPDQPIPGVSTRRLLREGNGEIVARGTTVDLTYDMYSWSTGELVESSSLRDGGVLQVTLGGSERRVPAIVEQSIVGRTAGSRVQVVLGQGVSDLPDQLNPADGYVLVVDIAKQGPG